MLPRALLLLLLGCGCAPLADLRPASGLVPGSTHEVGAGGVVVGPRPHVDESASATGVGWFEARASSRVLVSAIGAFDAHSVAIGGALRVDGYRSRAFAAAIELQGGWAWAAVSLPMAVRVYDESWIYSSPRVGTIGRYLGFGLPLGVDVRAYRGLKLRSEAQVSWEAFEAYDRRLHFAGGAAYQW